MRSGFPLLDLPPRAPPVRGLDLPPRSTPLPALPTCFLCCTSFHLGLTAAVRFLPACHMKPSSLGSCSSAGSPTVTDLDGFVLGLASNCKQKHAARPCPFPGCSYQRLLPVSLWLIPCSTRRESLRPRQELLLHSPMPLSFRWACCRTKCTSHEG